MTMHETKPLAEAMNNTEAVLDAQNDTAPAAPAGAKASRSHPASPDVKAVLEAARKAGLPPDAPQVQEALRRAELRERELQAARKAVQEAAKAAEKPAEPKQEAAQADAPASPDVPQQAAAPKQETAPAAEKAAAPKQETEQPAETAGPTLIFGAKPVMPYSIEEAVNRLRINISFLGTDVKRIMVVSSEPNEGKSFVAMNLWKQMAMAGERSLLVDIDMRKSNMVPTYRMKRADGQELKGTSHFLSGNLPIREAILRTEIPAGDILPNVDNIVNPSMLLESRRFTELMAYGTKNYRYTFLDVPPLGLVSDGELIGSRCDGAILCVRGGVTPRGIVKNSIRQLERAGCPVLGIVLNRVGGSGSKYYHKYYGKKYYYNDQYYQR